MRVLSVGSMYPPHALGGYELMWRSVTEALVRSGHEAEVLASDFRIEGMPGDEPSVSRRLRWYWHDHRFPATSLRERYEVERFNLAELARRMNAPRPPDLIAFWAMGGMSMSLVEAARRSDLPVLGVVHDDWLAYGPRVDQWQRAFGRRALRHVAERIAGVPTMLRFEKVPVVFNSESTRATAMTRWPLEETSVITPGVDLDLFAPRSIGKEWEGKLLYVGRIDERKGIATAIASLEGLPGMSLRIIGSGDDAHLADLRMRARERGVEGRIEFATVARERVPAEYAAADALLFPVTWQEPWGLVPLEAMAVGTPVVASGRGGSAEFLRDGRNCLLYTPAEDPAALADAVRRLADDESLREQLRHIGIETAREHGLEEFDRRMVALHERVAR